MFVFVRFYVCSQPHMYTANPKCHFRNNEDLISIFKKSLQELSELNRLLKFSVRYVLIKFTMSFLKKS